uniref:Uncharacterized protein n=1 Tax=Rhizophora mucronata TaxID=61149 RepID=A0A2P2JNQ0_RHIMU
MRNSQKEIRKVNLTRILQTDCNTLKIY